MNKEITYENFDGLCPLVKAGWKPLHNDKGITLTLYTRQDGIPVDVSDYGVGETPPGAFAQDALVKTCRDCSFAWTRPDCNNVCFPSEAVPEPVMDTILPIAAINIEIRNMSKNIEII